MYERILRNLIAMLFWVAMFLITVALEVVLFSVTYLSFGISCDLMGYEHIPLGRDVLIGWFFSAFLADATVATLFAMSLSGVNTFGLFLFFYLMFECIEIIEDKRTYRGASQENISSALNRPMRRNLIIMATILVLLIPSFALDLSGVRFRIVNGIEGNEYPEEAAQIMSWDRQKEVNGDRMAYDFASVSLFGYLAINILGGVISAYAVHKLSECWVRLWDSFRPDLIPPGGGGPGGANLTGITETENDAGDSHEQYDATPDSGLEAQTVHEDTPDPSNALEPDIPVTQAGTPDLDEMVDVVGSDERVTLAQAMSDSRRFWIDPETHAVWDKEFRRGIMDEQSEDHEEE